jgi:alkanesulfonate monooxygenase
LKSDNAMSSASGRAASDSSHSDVPVEWGWFAPCCEDDFRVPRRARPGAGSTPEHVRDVVLAAEAAGFQNILLPSGFNTGVDAWVMACALASQTSTISLLPAIRVGEHHPPMMARAAANLDRILNGRLNINIISSPVAGLPPESSAVRYERTQEFMHVLKAFWQQVHVEYSGTLLSIRLEVRHSASGAAGRSAALFWWRLATGERSRRCAGRCVPVLGRYS